MCQYQRIVFKLCFESLTSIAQTLVGLGESEQQEIHWDCKDDGRQSFDEERPLPGKQAALAVDLKVYVSSDATSNFRLNCSRYQWQEPADWTCQLLGRSH